MDLLVDFINEQGVMAFASNPDKIIYNLNLIPPLKQNIAEQKKIRKDAFSAISVAGRWIVVYKANVEDNENTMMHFIDFRIDIDSQSTNEIFSTTAINGIKTIQNQYDDIYTPKHDTVELQLTFPFSNSLIKDWENDSCVNFSIALARITGWIIHIDSWVNTQDPEENTPEKDRVPLRVYVGDNLDNVFDVRGIMKLQKFCQSIIEPLAIINAKSASGSVATKIYSEAELAGLPYNFKPNESEIVKAIDAIKSNHSFLDCISKRQFPNIPAHVAAKFTYGLCAPFAEALHELKELPIAAMIAIKYTPQFELSKLGYIHSFVLHPDGSGEDSWGKQTVEHIAERFGVAEYELSSTEHEQAVGKLRLNSLVKFDEAYNEALELISKYSNNGME